MAVALDEHAESRLSAFSIPSRLMATHNNLPVRSSFETKVMAYSTWGKGSEDSRGGECVNALLCVDLTPEISILAKVNSRPSSLRQQTSAGVVAGFLEGL